MPSLPTDLRKTLEAAIIAARRAAEDAARASLTTLAVARADPFATMDEAQRQLRRGLRAKARQLGDDTKSDALPLLTHEIAYEQWHRMLFARFLAENDLLMHSSGVAVSLADCAELALEVHPEPGRREGAADAWDLAARYAGAMLPGIFPADDPAVQVRFAPEGRQKLEAILAGLPPAVFTADDGLGWVYQFWQTDKKREVNASGRKIGGADLAPVTQLFTEDYMVRFLLENSLGAWWAARHPDSPLVREWGYLRWREEGDGNDERGMLNDESADSAFIIQRSAFRIPAAGAFPGWPDRAALITCMDPCGGSGHFVVAEFGMLLRMRMEEEGLSATAAGDAVIRDNLFMLELDPRCTQIATFALALAAWKSGGYRPLPTPNIACSGIAVTGQLEDWLRLARGDERLQTALERLHKLFTNAPTLGSLINPADVPLAERMFSADYEEVAPLLARALARERGADDPAAAVLGAAAEGVAKAAKLLAGQYTLVATNVPYLARGKQSVSLCDFCQKHYLEGKNDLATVFLERCLEFCTVGGTASLVLPQNWLFLTSYRALREKLLESETWHLIVRLGPAAFDTISGEVVKAILITLSRNQAPADHAMHGFDVSALHPAAAKAIALLTTDIKRVGQWGQLRNPDARVMLEEATKQMYLFDYADCWQGIVSSDDNRFVLRFWEIPVKSDQWEWLHLPPQESAAYTGRSGIIRWEGGAGPLHRTSRAHNFPSKHMLGRPGIAIQRMRDLNTTLFSGDIFGDHTAPIIPRDVTNLPAIVTFCFSEVYRHEVRKADATLKASIGSLTKVPFDLEHWTQVAQERYPDGLPEPYSNDPTQWLFAGHPAGATEPLQVAVARLLGYRWPQQAQDNLGAFADADGIVCLPAVAGEQPAAERLRALLAAAFAAPQSAICNLQSAIPGWSAAVQEQLLAAVGFAGKTLDDWLADGFFPQHCRVFHNRPCIWHIWDGRHDGFSALVNYHKLDRAGLEKLIYTTLGAWIARQRAERDAGAPAAEGRLVASLALQKKLIAILEGEPPYDIYVRWKPLYEQPVGWEPDLNDGVRLNIRPFVTAGVLRSRFTIHWKVDRGTNLDPNNPERINDRHLARAEKQAAREKGRG